MKRVHPTGCLFLLIATLVFLSACVCHRPTEPDNHQPKVIIPPTADAGIDQNTFVSSYAILDGSGSQKSETSEYLEWDWIEDESNPARTLNWNSDSVKRTGYPLEGTYTYYLRVNDQDTVSLPDTVVVHVEPRLPGLIEDLVLELTIRWQLQKQLEQINNTLLMELTELDPYSAIGIPNTPIRSLSGLESCENLEKFIFSYTGVNNFLPISNLNNLKELNISQADIKDIQFLSNLTNLIKLDIFNNNISDISPIAYLINLEYLKFSWNPVTDISVLVNLTKMKDLHLSGIDINDLSPISNMSNLEILWIDYCKRIMNLTPLRNLNNIQMLELTFNRIMDLSPLSNLKKLRWLYLSKNQIKDISNLEDLINLEVIELNDNLIEDIEPLLKNEGIGEGDLIGLRGNPLNLASRKVFIPRLLKRGAHVDF